MLIIVDHRIPQESKDKLNKIGEVVEFSTTYHTYEAISSHPDVFLCKTNDNLIIAPNTPDKYFQILISKGIKFLIGTNCVGKKYPESAIYNALITEQYLIHNIKITDKTVIYNSTHLETIAVKQGYTKCNLLAFRNNSFITSDIGIYNVLDKKECNVLYVSPEYIILEGFTNGFFGGACGIYENTVFINGNLDFYPDGRKVRKFIKGQKYKIVELYKGPLFDGGSILFI